MAKQHQEEENFKEMELWEHLAELRTRIARALLYFAAGMVLAWIFFDPLYHFLSAPITPVLKQIGGQLATMTLWDPFMAQMQISIFAGLILALPFATFELWRFVAPGLTRSERKAVYICMPLSLFFFALGLVTAYLILPSAFRWFAGFASFGGDRVLVLQNPRQYAAFVAKMLFAFGVTFQMPVVLMGLAYAELVTSAGLLKHWRLAFVICAVLGAVATPGGDPMSMMVMAIPLAVLYVASIFLVRFVERLRARNKALRPSYDTT